MFKSTKIIICQNMDKMLAHFAKMLAHFAKMLAHFDKMLAHANIVSNSILQKV